jgi:hypothetical protein
LRKSRRCAHRYRVVSAVHIGGGRPIARLKAKYDCNDRLENCQYTGARWISANTPANLREFTHAYPQRMSLDVANTLAYLCTSPYGVRLAQKRFPKIHFHPLREYPGLHWGRLVNQHKPPAQPHALCSSQHPQPLQASQHLAH